MSLAGFTAPTLHKKLPLPLKGAHAYECSRATFFATLLEQEVTTRTVFGCKLRVTFAKFPPRSCLKNLNLTNTSRLNRNPVAHPKAFNFINT